MRKPNFFILGAPKCGTTSLASWLSDHSNVYMCPLKEPMWFIDDAHYHNVYSWREYERLFRDVEATHMAIGEGSTLYLQDRSAVDNILDYSADAKFIVMLRNPVEMAPSFHEQLIFNGEEDILDFNTAWAMQEQRRDGRNVPRLCRSATKLVYGDICSLGAQLDRVLRKVDSSRVQVLFLEDVKKYPRQEYLKTLKFLGVPDDRRKDFPVQNSAKTRRSQALGKVVSSVGAVKRSLGIHRGFGVLRAIDQKNVRQRPRASLTPEMRSKLQAYFRGDIGRLEELTGRDLSAWLNISVDKDEPSVG